MEVHMKKSTYLIIGVLGLGLIGGCVSTSKYKKAVNEKSGLQAKADQLAKENADLQANISQLQGESSALTQERDALKQSKSATETQYAALVGELANELQQGELQIKQYKNMLSVDVAEKIFFASGSANIKESGKKVLQKVGNALAQYQDKVIRVVGHTDNVPVAKSYQNVFPTNWELSAMRATNVVRFLQDNCKIVPERLIAAGRGEYSPIAPNDTPENRQKNRRIEIMLLDKSMVDAMGNK